MFVKICGITRPEDARLAESAGADAIGMIFVSGSRRELDVERAAPIAEAVGPFVVRIGVFRDAPIDRVRGAARRLRLHGVQLHGSEDAAYVAALRSELTVVKALSYHSDLTADDLAAYGADAILLDGPDPGSGRAFSWAEAAPLVGASRVVVAGGLTPENVHRAVEAVRPYAVDVASGVETAPGLKDQAKVRAFVARAKAAARAMPRDPRSSAR